MSLSAFIVMSALEAARYRDLTAGDEARLDPVPVRGGPHQGKYALPARVKVDPDFAEHHDAFGFCDEVPLDIDMAFPPTEEELAARAAADA